MSSRDQYTLYELYRLKKEIPLCKKGTIFYYDPNDSNLGSINAGCLKMAWTKDGDCQNGLRADTIVFHANARHEKEWFELVSNSNSFIYIPTGIEYNGEPLYKKVES